MIAKMERLLEERVRPFLRQHGGDAEIVGFEDGILKLHMLGQCAGCPAASLTNETLIEEELKKAIPALKQVVLIQKVEESLLDEARRRMKRSSAACSE